MMDSDTLSDALLRMRLKTSTAGIFDAAGRWGAEFPPFEGFKLQVILKGEHYVLLDGGSKKLHLQAGDCVLLTGRQPVVIASDPSVKKRFKGEDLIALKKNGVITINGGGDLLSLATYFEFDGHLPAILFKSLPSYIHVAGHSDQAAVLRWALERFKAEYFNQAPGRALILNHLAPIMLVQILRMHLAAAPKGQNSWLSAISDTHLSKAFDRMHSRYREPWSLESLAKVAGLSRSGFALSFKKKVGISPLDYLANWRMQVACNLLRTEGQTIASVAREVGYESESAFSVAFNRIIRCRPGQYQKMHRAQPLTPLPKSGI